MKNRIKSFLCRKVCIDKDRKGFVNLRKKSISFNLEKALKECYDY